MCVCVSERERESSMCGVGLCVVLCHEVVCECVCWARVCVCSWVHVFPA